MPQGRLETAVFRFSNQDGQVIDLHQDVLNHSDNGYVWWGWWKKSHEPRRDDALRELQSLTKGGESLRIGLLNRKDEQFYSAVIDEVRFEIDGARSIAPDQMCPEFYRHRDPGCPAWLRVRRFERISQKDYGAQFGPEPVGDPTLYEIRRLNGKRLVIPEPSWDMVAAEAPGDSILHLSDIHFGSSHGYQQRMGRTGDSVSTTTMAARVLDAVRASQREVGVVVVSGDLVSKANTDDFSLVEDFLDEILEDLRLQKRHLVIVPGNHDFKTLEAMDVAPTMDYAHERKYRDFLSSYFGWKGTELERLFHFRMSNGQHAVFGGLNSARLRGRESKEYGYVGRHRYADMFDFMQRSLDRQQVSARLFAVLHHHLVPVQEMEVPRPGVPISITVDAAELFGELQMRAFDVVLHGHQHRPFYFRGHKSLFSSPTKMVAPTRQLTVIGNGTSGAGGEALVPDFPFNSIGIYSLDEMALRAATYYYNAAVAPQPLGMWEVPWETTP